ncbi:MAG TPA: hypothetical protein DEQ87_17720 [Algoriphagus sp.]|jgi:hypothetical protein|uniref:hypothetical protein n=1 Tax=unclassified Algoriphagus TaxID=2641541 RepID=UPI000C54775F|nr:MULTISPECIES: hypothetical protein [unclassified Algoriphagus]MAL12914.1 hypothetical protein [Algoriphagus sp.]MAN86340.1 hypothetical protein [Algoriphagus sp.]QYH39186.1 hypothetical protein GYM62_10415 [Algoriphagus sp. NBT04N3]HAS58282.1 hypothetical protein [Algoriphagus sp.]HAZ24254.1 hypothetical protein [Algoriphagus sp.]
MNKLAKLLPALALVLGATLAMAMNFANPQPMQVFAEDPENPGQFIDVTSLEPGVDYICDQTGDCLYDAPNGNVVQQGTFIDLR